MSRSTILICILAIGCGGDPDPAAPQISDDGHGDVDASRTPDPSTTGGHGGTTGGSSGTAGTATGGAAGTVETTGGSGGTPAPEAGVPDAGCIPVEPTVSRIGLGSQHGCALRPTGEAVCWGTPSSFFDHGQNEAPADLFSSIEANGSVSCGLTADESALVCWGEDLGTPPPGAVARITVGASHACALDACGAVTCWGSASGVEGTPSGRFIDAAAGSNFTCALTAEGRVACWGQWEPEPSSLPSGTFRAVAAGESHSCAIRTDGTVTCWMASHLFIDDFGQTAPPPGTFKQLALGVWHTCGIRDDDTVSCWGHGTAVGDCSNAGECGQAMPPSGEFEQIAAGLTNTCGIRTDGSIECWGSNTGGRSTPPAPFP
jgi:alpha-tubulin suppressor-like RCC1 family protein